MKKRIKIKLNNEEEKIEKICNAIYTNSKIRYNDDCSVTLYLMSDPKMIRETDDYFLEISFVLGSTTNNTFHLKKENIKLNIKVTTKSLNITDSIIEINYTIDNKPFYFSLELMEE